jgi:hypothetical protein
MKREAFDNVLLAARIVQDFLWGEADARGYSDETWLKILTKRIIKLQELDPKEPHAHVEKRKRVLQVAAVALAWLENMGGLGPQPDDVSLAASATQKEPKNGQAKESDAR